MIIHNIKYFILVDFDYEKDLIRDQDFKSMKKNKEWKKPVLPYF